MVRGLIGFQITRLRCHNFFVIYVSYRYTLLTGKPPFETQTLQDTYKKIKKNEYVIPSRMSPLAKSLIQRLLHAKPSSRPTVEDILADDFMTKGMFL